MVKFLLWCILLVFCWPLALLALVLYPIVWLLLLPFRHGGYRGGWRAGAGGQHHPSAGPAASRGLMLALVQPGLAASKSVLELVPGSGRMQARRLSTSLPAML